MQHYGRPPEGFDPSQFRGPPPGMQSDGQPQVYDQRYPYNMPQGYGNPPPYQGYPQGMPQGFGAPPGNYPQYQGYSQEYQQGAPEEYPSGGGTGEEAEENAR